MSARLPLVVGLSALALACNEPAAPEFVRPPNAVDVVVDFCAHFPAWIAVKNEGYDWQAIPVVSLVSRYTLPVTPKVGVAFGVVGGNFSAAFVFYLTAQELASMNCGPARGSKSVYAPVAGNAASDIVKGNLGQGMSFMSPDKTRITFISVPTGPQDLVVSRSQTPSFGEKFIVRHDVDAADRDTLPVLDFASAEAVAPVMTPIIAPGTTGFPSARFITNRGVSAVLATAVALSADTNGYAALLPASAVAPGDRFSVTVSGTTRFATRYFNAPGPQNITLGPALNTPTVSTLRAAAPMLMRAVLASQPEYPSLVTARFEQLENGRQVHVTVTAGYLDGTPSQWTIDVPDLSAVIHRDQQLASGVTVTTTVEAWNARIPLYFYRLGANDGEIVRCASKGEMTFCRSPLLLYPY